MTAVTPVPTPPPSRLAAIGRGIRHFGGLIAETYRGGLATIWLVPAFVAIAAIPEFVQHVAEIQLGMFTSREAAHAVANSALRWQFGYAKLAGLVVAMILIGRFWARQRSWRAALVIPPRTLIGAGAAILLLCATGWLFSPDRVALPMSLDIARSIVSTIIQTGLFAWIGGIVYEDGAAALRTTFTERFPAAIVMTLLFVIAMVPLQVVHWLDHRLALGAPSPLVWMLMTWDTLVVGAMAGVAGTGLYIGYRSGLTWRGWRTVEGLPDLNPTAS